MQMANKVLQAAKSVSQIFAERPRAPITVCVCVSVGARARRKERVPDTAPHKAARSCRARVYKESEKRRLQAERVNEFRPFGCVCVFM